MKKTIAITLALALTLALSAVGVSAQSSSTQGDYEAVVSLPTAPPPRIALTLGKDPDMAWENVNDFTFEYMVRDTDANAEINTMYLDVYEQDYYAWEFSNLEYLASYRKYGVITLAFTSSPVHLVNPAKYDFGQVLEVYMDFFAQYFKASDIRFSLRTWNPDTQEVGICLATTSRRKPTIHALNNDYDIGTYYFVDNNYYAGERFLPPLAPVDFVFCVDVGFFWIDSNINEYDSLVFGITQNTGDAITFKWLNTFPEEGDSTTPYPPGFNNPIYPAPSNPGLVEDEDIENEIQNDVNEVQTQLNNMLSSFRRFLVPLGGAFSKVSTIYARLTLEVPILANLVEISLYIGLVAFVLGSSALALFNRRKK